MVPVSAPMLNHGSFARPNSRNNKAISLFPFYGCGNTYRKLRSRGYCALSASALFRLRSTRNVGQPRLTVKIVYKSLKSVT
jgi:hypothetical protein